MVIDLSCLNSLWPKLWSRHRIGAGSGFENDKLALVGGMDFEGQDIHGEQPVTQRV